MVEEQAKPRKNGHVIYLVEDDEEDVVLFRMAAQTCFPHDTIRFFNSGMALLRCFEQKTGELPDVIFINNTLPILDGIQTLSELRQFPESLSIPKVFISGVLLEKHIEQARKAGAVACLVKPHSVDELAAILTHSQEMWKT